MTDSLLSFSEQLAATVDHAGQSVVAVHARPRFDSSGVLWSPEIVVTADHTVRREDDLRVTAAKGTSFAAELLGRDPGTDLAALRVNGLDGPVAARAAKSPVRPG